MAVSVLGIVHFARELVVGTTSPCAVSIPCMALQPGARKLMALQPARRLQV